MASYGILLFTFSLVLLAVNQVSQISIWESLPLLRLVPTPPVCFSTALRIASIAISFGLMFVVAEIWRRRRLSKVAFGVVLFLLLLFVLWLIPPIPVLGFFTALGITGLLTSLVFMVAVFRKDLPKKLKDFFEGQRPVYWVIFWLVYIFGWLKGMGSIPTGGLAFPIVFGIGFAWFLAIMIAMLKDTCETGKRK